MKNLYFALVMMVILPLSLMAKVNLDATAHQTSKEMMPKVTVSKDYLLNLNNIDKEDQILPQSQFKFKVLDRTVDVIFNTLYDGITPMVYEPISSTIFVVQTNRFTENEQDNILNGEIYIYWSQDKGATWNKEVAFSSDGDVPVNASIAVVNPKNSTNPNDCVIVLFSRYFKYDAISKEYAFQGGLYLFSNGKGMGVSNFDRYEEAGPLTNNPGTNQNWNSVKTISYSNGANSFVYVYGTLSPKTNQQYGSYGFGNVAINASGIQGNYSIMPPQWGALTWRSTGDVNTSYNAPIYIDVDPNGTLYACVNNIFVDDQENRVVAISKSNDNGKTWSNWERMPANVIDAYKTKHGLESCFQPKPYSSSGFVVTGVDEFSFVLTFRKVVSSASEIFEDKFVEVYKKDGVWSMQDIANSTSDKWRTPYFISDTTGSDTIVYDGFEDNPRGYEIELAKTADGQNIVLKYIDNREDLVGLNEPLQLVNTFMVDTTLSTDIWVANRKTSDVNTWSQSKSITDDIWMNKCTWMPRVVPSATEVPLMENVTVKFTNPTNVRVINKYPYFIQNFVIGSYIRNDMLISSFDAVNPSNIKDENLQKAEGANGIPVGSVDDMLNPEILYLNVYPNPASGDANITFNIDRVADVKIEIFNTMGQLVKTVYNAKNMNFGISAVNFNVEDLSAGTYFYTLTANGKSTTKMLNIVR